MHRHTNDTAQLVIFTRAVTVDFDVEFFTRKAFPPQSQERISDKLVIKVAEKFELNPSKLCGFATDVAPPMTGRANGLTKKYLDAVAEQDVVVGHCIANQENLCVKVLAFT